MKTAYPNTTQPVSITLYSNIPFDNTYKNHTIISNLFKYNSTRVIKYNTIPIADRLKRINERFIDRLDYTQPVGSSYAYYYKRFTLEGEYNFDFTNGLIGSVVLELTSEQTNANYLRIKVPVSLGYEYYYYFITGITQLNVNTYKLSLECDVLMTYQDDFLEGMKDIPVSTKRKHSHRYTENGLLPYCADLKTGEDIFSNIKPSIIKDIKKLHYDNPQMKKLEGIYWLYICFDKGGSGSTSVSSDDVLFTCNDNSYPFITLCIPINANSITFDHINGGFSVSKTRQEILQGIGSLIGEGSVHGAKISPYPPFSITALSGEQITNSGGDLTIKGYSTTYAGSLESGYFIFKMTIGGNVIYYGKILTLTPTTFSVKAIDVMMKCGACLLGQQDRCTYEHETLTLSDMGLVNAQKPSVLLTRYKDPKLLFNPFRKYKLSAQYSSDGSEFYPELLFAEEKTTSNGEYFEFISIATGYIGDNNFYTYLRGVSNTYKNYRYEKVGLASSVNYTFPSGTNALDVFNATQSQAFYQSKTASGITSGLTIAGGIGSTAIGIASMVGTQFLSTPASVGLIAGGIGAIASGTAGISNNIKSSQAKIEDLKNTPDSLNVSGSNFITDNEITGGYNDTNCYPYITITEVPKIILENADDYFYDYGYQVSRCCYFNQELKYDFTSAFTIDNNLFGRTIFNYIQINEDITNKINADIPLIIKQKLSSIFNQGITIWSFFGFDELWNLDNSVPTSTYYIDNWFMKNTLDNSEYDYMVS